ncbi:uncharacterized protein LY89DRAFT_579308 [Mollisia scopiformis]|uniref:RRM domain-containing protein n=1 Tax=Mollisia scopiformis TaxID=149040 RepID=A0A194XKP7_MOLSC|nr:uncharacterized protein LY89DRAFT_579308 [Mollisia scopiformis]KUJ20733.1 hypothetical protein LY89DRAFT_579308 [Mollisia scopiformis]
MSANTVHVKNISSQTSEKEIRDFFSFCGKITSLEVSKSEPTQDATVTFEKETAAKTALLLDNTQLGATQVQVSSATGSSEDDGSHYKSQSERESDEITQEEKPRSRIIAEYLAHGYVVGDQAIQRAIELDQKHGVSNRFVQTLTSLDSKYHATDKAKSVDNTYGVSSRANTFLTGLTSYYEKATDTPTGKKLVNFYTQASRQVQDIHNEARRLADLKKQDSGVSKVPGSEKTTCKCNSNCEECPCAPGQCACVGCAKSDVKEAAGTKKTTCNCGGDTGKCGCAPGNCACSSCPKSDTEKVAGTEKTTCNCGGDTAKCACAPGACACKSCPKADTEKVAGSDKTTCKCGGNTEKCGCAPGACACSSCPKAKTEKVAGTDKTTCNCGGDEKNCPCEAGKCACGGCSK